MRKVLALLLVLSLSGPAMAADTVQSQAIPRVTEKTESLVLLSGLVLLTAGVAAIGKDNSASGICGAVCACAGAGLIIYRFGL